MLPADVSIRMLAWPVPVIRTGRSSSIALRWLASKVPGPCFAGGGGVRDWKAT
jgi:hypothetical protein